MLSLGLYIYIYIYTHTQVNLKSNKTGITDNSFLFKTTNYMVFSSKWFALSVMHFPILPHFYVLLERFFWDALYLHHYNFLNGLHAFKTGPLLYREEQQKCWCIKIKFDFFLVFLNYAKCKSESEVIEIHTHESDNCSFLWNFSAFLLCSAHLKFFHSLYNFQDTHTIHTATPSVYALHMLPV